MLEDIQSQTGNREATRKPQEREAVSIPRAGEAVGSWFPGAQDPAALGEASPLEGLLAGTGPQREGLPGEGRRPRGVRATVETPPKAARGGRGTLVSLLLLTGVIVFYLDSYWPDLPEGRGREPGEYRGGSGLGLRASRQTTSMGA